MKEIVKRYWLSGCLLLLSIMLFLNHFLWQSTGIEMFLKIIFFLNLLLFFKILHFFRGLFFLIVTSITFVPIILILLLLAGANVFTYKTFDVLLLPILILHLSFYTFIANTKIGQSVRKIETGIVQSTRKAVLNFFRKD